VIYLSEYRALTQGGCLSGSQTFTADGTFTAPSGVTKVKIVIGDYTYYFSVSPGSSYSVSSTMVSSGDGGGFATVWTFNGNQLSLNTSDLIIYWSNAINNS
jgi:hypothetical protein